MRGKLPLAQGTGREIRGHDTRAFGAWPMSEPDRGELTMAKEVRLSFAVPWQTALAVPLACVIYMLGVLIGGGIGAFISTGSALPGHGPDSVVLLAVSGWIGVWCAPA